MDQRRVCVTGASGYVGSWLVNKLLKKGHVVHATVRNVGDDTKVQLLKSFHGAESRLKLFQADIYESDEFGSAIEGCECVFLVATPLQHTANSTKYKDTTEASLSAIKTILQICEQSNSVKRVIYTGTIFSASPIKDDGSGFKDFFDESCWTPLDLPFRHLTSFIKDYIISKTLSEKEILSYNSKEDKIFDVVSLICGLIGGDTLLPYCPGSLATVLSPITGDETSYRPLIQIQEVLGSVPLAHIDDACEAHIFCMEQVSISGRFLCVAVIPSIQEFKEHFITKGIKINTEANIQDSVEDSKKVPKANYEPRLLTNKDKLCGLGFKYKHSFESILDGSVECAKRLGYLNHAGEYIA